MMYRTVEVEPEIFDGVVNVNADINNAEIETQAEMSTTVTHVYTEGGALPEGGVAGDILIKRSNGNYDVEWVAPATSAEQDNARPITAGAVYTEIGNINAILATI